jgi:predicted O-methyltransferase YrrM
VVDQHSIHSPFFFDFYCRVLKADTHRPAFDVIERTRTHLLKSDLTIDVLDLGAGSRHVAGTKRRLADIASTSVTPAPWARFYHRICQQLEAKRVLELGTSLGLTTLYLAQVPGVRVFTCEGSSAIAGVAQTNFEHMSARNISLLQGPIDDTLDEFLQDPAKLDFVLMDANHRYEPTVHYFNRIMRRLSEKSIVAIDDIHQSAEMEKAWHELKNHPVVYGSVDLFRCGLLFFDPALHRQHFIWNL